MTTGLDSAQDVRAFWICVDTNWATTLAHIGYATFGQASGTLWYSNLT